MLVTAKKCAFSWTETEAKLVAMLTFSSDTWAWLKMMNFASCFVPSSHGNFNFVLMQNSFGGVPTGRKRACVRQGRPRRSFALCSAKSLATYVHMSIFMTSLWPSEGTGVATLDFWCHRGGDLPLDLQRVSTFPAHGSPPLRLPEDGEPVHFQSGGSGCRQLLLLRFKPRHREERLLQVHPSHPSATWWRSVKGSSDAHSWPSLFSSCYIQCVLLVWFSGERKYPADITVKFPDTTAMLASNISLECFALGK